MGRDIHMHIVRNGKELANDIYGGRDSDWFDNLTNKCVTEPAYDLFPLEWYWDDINCPKTLYDRYTQPEVDGGICYYFNHRKVKVGDFREWYLKYKPQLKAGYVSKYDLWLYEEKHIPPRLDYVERYLWSEGESEESYIKDKVWIEFEYEYEPSTWLYAYLENHVIPDDAWIIYCFD